MKLLYIHIEENYKHIKAGGYYFDREFIVKKFIPRGNKKIELETNKNYHHPFNNNINNISCIVGKNGIGKTTFFELIISPLLWRLDGEILLGKIHLLFYDEINEDFYVESYINNSQFWNIKLNGENKNIYKNIFSQNDNGDKNQKYEIENNKFSVMPFQINIIFHSLSPFDRIYDLLKKQLSSASDGQIGHYYKRVKYVGIKQIEKNEVTYEYMTLINLISILVDEKSKIMFSNLGYEYGNIEINVENKEYFHQIKIPNFKEIENYKFLFNKETYQKFQSEIYIELKANTIGERFFKELILKSIKIDTPSNFSNFLTKVMVFHNNKVDEINILEKSLDYIENIDYIEAIIGISSENEYEFLKDIFEKKNVILKLNELKDKEKILLLLENNELLILLKYLKRLINKDFLSFKFLINKNGNELDYFRLSSGEKTLLSYFANILGKIKELDEIQTQDITYDNVKNKTYLILIDEVELHLHPEWQRNFIKQLNDFFTYEDNTKKFQFVIATHSPFVVSDIYDENIIYLGQDNINSKTFGGNIFDIFKDDFYVSNTIGSFSEEIIKELSEILYVLFAIKKAEKEDNFFMLRDFFDLMYKTDNKEEENELLLKNINKFIFEFVKDKQFQKIDNNKYLKVIYESLEVFYKEINLIINNIGEEVIKEHLQKMFNYVRESND